jgi:predicted phosphoribosyltransferase
MSRRLMTMILFSLAPCYEEDVQMRFKDRADAGRHLAVRLASYKNDKPVVLALPRGGVAVAAEVAAALNVPMDIVLVRKIGAPIQPELALGAVVDGSNPIIVRNPYIIESTATNEEEFQALCREQLAEIERRRVRYVGQRKPLNVEGRVVIVVDDGIATGATMRAALQATRIRRPGKLVLAVPVAPAAMLESLCNEADDVICLADIGPFGAIGTSYDDFRQLTDDDVVAALDRFSPSSTEPRGIDESDVRRVIGDIDAAKLPEILALAPSREELEEASVWATGNGDLRAKKGHPLRGKAAAIFDILTADTDDDRR